MRHRLDGPKRVVVASDLPATSEPADIAQHGRVAATSRLVNGDGDGGYRWHGSLGLEVPQDWPHRRGWVVTLDALGLIGGQCTLRLRCQRPRRRTRSRRHVPRPCLKVLAVLCKIVALLMVAISVIGPLTKDVEHARDGGEI